MILTIHCFRPRPLAGQSNSSTVPGRTPRAAILPQALRSPLILHTLTLLHPHLKELQAAYQTRRPRLQLGGWLYKGLLYLLWAALVVALALNLVTDARLVEDFTSLKISGASDIDGW